MLGQKTLHWQLSRVIPSGMYNFNFGGICLKKEKEKVRNGIWVIYLHNHCLSDALDKIYERTYVTFALRTFVCLWLP